MTVEKHPNITLANERKLKAFLEGYKKISFDRLNRVNYEVNWIGFNVLIHYQGSTRDGYDIANYNALDEFDQPTMSHASNLKHAISNIAYWAKSKLKVET